MIYAIVAPGISLQTRDWRQIERIRALYPYPKWKTCRDEQEATDFIRRHNLKKSLSTLKNYGDTVRNLYLTVEYKITPNNIFYKMDTKHCGRIKVKQLPDNLVQYEKNMIYIRVEAIKLNPDMLSSHMAAIYNIYDIVGDYIDVNVLLPNFSVYYALTSYTRDKVRSVKMTKDRINKRLCKTGYSLNMLEDYYE